MRLAPHKPYEAHIHAGSMFLLCIFYRRFPDGAALSRALYKNAPLVLLDEPTSELDPKTSRVIIEQILRLKQSATVIAASHDAALIEQADLVVTL